MTTETKETVSIVNDGKVTCPRTGKDVSLHYCFAHCDRLKSVSPKDGGELRCTTP